MFGFGSGIQKSGSEKEDCELFFDVFWARAHGIGGFGGTERKEKLAFRSVFVYWILREKEEEVS